MGLAIIAALAYEKTKSVWTSVAVHLTHNLMSILSVVLLSNVIVAGALLFLSPLITVGAVYFGLKFMKSPVKDEPVIMEPQYEEN